jgi:peptidoglycan hydrolase CwlO-like protein
MWFPKNAQQKRIDELAAEKAGLTAALASEKQAHGETKREERILGEAFTEMLNERDEARSALRDIIAMETPGSAHIGRKMAARARQALPGGSRLAQAKPSNGAAAAHH